MIRNLFSSTPFVLLSLLAADGGASAGGGAAAPAKPSWAPSDKAPELAGDSLEDKNRSALAIIGDLFKNLGAAFIDFTRVQGEKTDLQTQFDAATSGWNKEKEDHVATKGLLETEKGAHIATKGELDTATKNVSRLETLCGLNGIDKDQAVPTASAPGGDKKAQLAAEHKALKEKEDKGEAPRGSASKFFKKHKAELKGDA